VALDALPRGLDGHPDTLTFHEPLLAADDDIVNI
jgi:hypothetical protein